jgi:hypothetical protein
VAGGCRGRRLAEAMTSDGHAVRITARSEQSRAAIEASGAECWIGTPDRLATLRGALDSVTILCWLLGCASGAEQELEALHSSRLEFFLTQAIDTTVRGFIYEARGSGRSGELAREGQSIVRAVTQRNAIPTSFLLADPADLDAWLADAGASVASLLMRA